MRRIHLIVLATWVVIAPVLAGCADFDPDKWDVFGWNEKKKLPGDRKAVFPEGVPGVSQGIPPEFVKGSQPPADAAEAVPAEPVDKPAAAKPSKKTAAVEPGEKPKAKTAKRKVKPAATAAAPAQGGDPQQTPAAWPAQGQGQPQGQSSSSAPWPASPAPGTFSR